MAATEAGTRRGHSDSVRMRLNRGSPWLLAAVFALAATPSTWAQCPYGWSEGFDLPGNGVNGVIRDMIMHDDGTGWQLYVVGEFTQAGDVAASNIARWNGTNWSAVGGGIPDGLVYAVEVHSYPAGSEPDLYVGGRFSSAGGTAVSGLARWDGTYWHDVGGGSSDLITSLESFSGALHVGGNFTRVGDTVWAENVAKWEGGAWYPLGNGLNGIVWDLRAFYDGTSSNIYAGGGFERSGSTIMNYCARWSGTTWEQLGSGLPLSGPLARVEDMAIFNDGTGDALYVVGGFYLAPSSGIAKWNGTAWSGVDIGLSGGIPKTILKFDAGGGPSLYIGGDFTGAGGMPFDRIVRWDGANWHAVGSGIDDTIEQLAFFDPDLSGPRAPVLFAGGDFATAGGLPSSNIARWWITGPTIIEQPQTIGVIEGVTVEFTVVATTTGSTDYQWYREGTALEDDERISGAQTDKLCISSVGPCDVGSYYVIITDECETTVSESANLFYSCLGDLGGDHEVGLADLQLLLAHYGMSEALYQDGDLDRDGHVDLADLQMILSAYGQPCGA